MSEIYWSVSNRTNSDLLLDADIETGAKKTSESYSQVEFESLDDCYDQLMDWLETARKVSDEFVIKFGDTNVGISGYEINAATFLNEYHEAVEIEDGYLRGSGFEWFMLDAGKFEDSYRTERDLVMAIADMAGVEPAVFYERTGIKTFIQEDADLASEYPDESPAWTTWSLYDKLNEYE